MKLYSGPLSLFTAKVRIALGEKDLAYERVEVGWSLENRYEPHHPDVVALNPKKEVPVLVDGDLSVYDSSLILEYLEDRTPSPPLLPADPAGRAHCRQLEAAADEILFPHVWDLIEARFYPSAEDGDERARRAEAGVHRYAEGLDKALAGRAYLCGDYSIADIGNFVMMFAAASLGAPAPDGLGNLAAWSARVLARPAPQREMAEIAAFRASLGT